MKWWQRIIQAIKTHRQKYLGTLIIIVLLGGLVVLDLPKPIPASVNYIQFLQLVNQHKISEVIYNPTSPTIDFTKKNNSLIYQTDNPNTSNFKQYLLLHDVRVDQITQQTNVLVDLISYALKLFMILLAFKLGMDWLNGNRFASEKTDGDKVPNVDFSKIAGNEEVKEEMQFLVQFLKNPRRFSEIGAKLPKGIVFYGDPGTGKTLTAKAIAGEAGVPFFSMSGSDFVEMYVGLGAKRVRDLFKKARKKSPSIIFIDEIDAVGTHRGDSHNSEKDQTINALLKEMDGFDTTDGVIVIAATNRIEDLDSALIRPGRFDKHIAIGLPDQNDRLAILKVHSQNKKLAKNVNLESIAKMTIGFSGAGLEALMNESAILAVTRQRYEISMEDIDDAYFKMVMRGHKKKNQKDRKEDELRLVAWHEASHALATKLLTDNEIPKVTIVSSTNGAGGVTFVTPKSMGLMSKNELINQIKVFYAGRIGELLFLGDENKVTNGASNDIEKATSLLKNLITRYGMSDSFGLLYVPAFRSDDDVLQEAIKLGKQFYQETLTMLSDYTSLIEKIVNKLLEKETLEGVELDELIANHFNLNKSHMKEIHSNESSSD